MQTKTIMILIVLCEYTFATKTINSEENQPNVDKTTDKPLPTIPTTLTNKTLPPTPIESASGIKSTSQEKKEFNLQKPLPSLPDVDQIEANESKPNSQSSSMNSAKPLLPKSRWIGKIFKK